MESVTWQMAVVEHWLQKVDFCVDGDTVQYFFCVSPCLILLNLLRPKCTHETKQKVAMILTMMMIKPPKKNSTRNQKVMTKLYNMITCKTFLKR